MHFLPNVEVRCPGCHGHRFTAAVLDVRRRDLWHGEHTPAAMMSTATWVQMPVRPPPWRSNRSNPSTAQA